MKRGKFVRQTNYKYCNDMRKVLGVLCLSPLVGLLSIPLIKIYMEGGGRYLLVVCLASLAMLLVVITTGIAIKLLIEK